MEQGQARVVAPGQKQNRTGGRAITSGPWTQQGGAGSPMPTRTGLAGAHCSWRVKQECRDKSQTLQPLAPRGMTAQGSSRDEEDLDKTCRGSHKGDTIGRKRREERRLSMIGSRTRPEGVMPGRIIAIELPRPGTPGHSKSQCSMWRHLCHLVARAPGAYPESGHGGPAPSWQRLHAEATTAPPK